MARMQSHRLSRWARTLATALTIALLAALPTTLRAQEGGSRAPLKLTFVDATPEQSGAIHDKLRKIIAGSDDIAFTKPEDFLFEAQDFNINLDLLGSEQKRKKNKELLRRAMRSMNLESIVVYRRTGDSLHLIVLGPSGAELKHYTAPVKRPRITDKQAVVVLKKLFKVLIPKVEKFRKRSKKKAKKKKKKDSEKKKAKSPDKSRLLERRVTATLSPAVGRRTLTIDAAKVQAALQHLAPFFGGGLQVDSHFGVLPSSNLALGAVVFLHYGRFATRFRGSGRTVQGTVFRAGGAVRLTGGLSDSFALFGELGAQGFDVGLESNPVYVGSSYFGLTAGGGLYYRFGSFGRLRVAVDVIPIPSTSTNEGVFGPSKFSVGFGADTRFTIRAFDPFVIAPYYILDLYRPIHPQPREYVGPATGNDFLHMGGVALGYRF